MSTNAILSAALRRQAAEEDRLDEDEVLDGDLPPATSGEVEDAPPEQPPAPPPAPPVRTEPAPGAPMHLVELQVDGAVIRLITSSSIGYLHAASAAFQSRLAQLVEQERQRFVQTDDFKQYWRLRQQVKALQSRLKAAERRQQDAEDAARELLLAGGDVEAALRSATAATAEALTIQKLLDGLADPVGTAEESVKDGWATALAAAHARLTRELFAERAVAERELSELLGQHRATWFAWDCCRRCLAESLPARFGELPALSADPPD